MSEYKSPTVGKFLTEMFAHWRYLTWTELFKEAIIYDLHKETWNEMTILGRIFIWPFLTVALFFCCYMLVFCMPFILTMIWFEQNIKLDFYTKIRNLFWKPKKDFLDGYRSNEKSAFSE